MRHLKAGKRLGVTTSHRKAMMRNLVTSLLEHGEIKTTITRAKEMRKYFDKMIGLGKRNNLHARRQAISFIKSKEVVNKLFEEYGPLYSERNGGYTRIYKIGRRLGDNAQMALIQMVDLKGEAKTEDKASTEKIKELKEGLEEETSTKEAKESAVDAVEVVEEKAEASEETAEVVEEEQASDTVEKADSEEKESTDESKEETGKEEETK